MVGVFKKSNHFLRSVILELKKVRWPTRKELISYTITVIIAVAFLTVFFALIDYGVSAGLRLITG